MLRNYLKSAFRSLVRHRSFTLINLLGLSVGIAAATLIYLVVDYERRFDTFHVGGEKVYRIVSGAASDNSGAVVPYPLGGYLRSKVPGVTVSQLHFPGNMVTRIGNREPVEEKDVLFADEHFFQVLNFGELAGFWVRGNPATALRGPGKVVLTQTVARRYFGSADPMGRVIRLDNKADAEVTGVIQDLPATSHLPIRMLVSYATLSKEFLAGIDPRQWDFRNNGYVYVRLQHQVEKPVVERALTEIIKEHAVDEPGRKERMYLQPLDDIHFNPGFEESTPTYTVSARYLGMLLLLAGFIVLIACINYVNLSTSLAFSKTKEVGIRKAIGASRAQLFFQYMAESFLVTAFAGAMGLGMVALLLPLVSARLEKALAIAQLLDAQFMGLALIGLLLISLLSGIYPALILSGFNPVVSLKKQFSSPGHFSVVLRKSLVVFQFATAIGLIVCTLVISRQVKYFSQKPLGFNKEAVVEVALPENKKEKRERFRTLLQSVPGVRSLSFCLGAPLTDNNFNTGLEAAELPKSAEVRLRVIPCDSAYRATYGIRMVAGRWFLPAESEHPGTAVVVNETLVRVLGYRQPEQVLGRKIGIGLNDIQATIVGVTQDFHTSSLHEAIVPCAMTPFPYLYYASAVRLDPAHVRLALAGIEAAWKKVYPEYTYRYAFIDENLARHYEQEVRDYGIFSAFSLVSIFICCIGLWGLIAFVVVHKTKEIGIRKVLGASARQIMALLSRDFLLLIGLAVLVASPIAWYFMAQWLENFAYRIPLSAWYFVGAGLLATVVALLTISFQTVQAATANPVKSLRTE